MDRELTDDYLAGMRAASCIARTFNIVGAGTAIDRCINIDMEAVAPRTDPGVISIRTGGVHFGSDGREMGTRSQIFVNEGEFMGAGIKMYQDGTVSIAGSPPFRTAPNGEPVTFVGENGTEYTYRNLGNGEHGFRAVGPDGSLDTMNVRTGPDGTVASATVRLGSSGASYATEDAGVRFKNTIESMPSRFGM